MNCIPIMNRIENYRGVIFWDGNGYGNGTHQATTQGESTPV